MSTVRSTARRPAASRIAAALIGGLASLGLLLGCSEAELEPGRGEFSFDADRIERELIQFQNRRAAWAKQYAESLAETNVNLREHLAHKDTATR
ncbi:MAG TPA: hypothetical protein VFZ85_08280 [Jiangellaceae bacterium]